MIAAMMIYLVLPLLGTSGAVPPPCKIYIYDNDGVLYTA